MAKSSFSPTDATFSALSSPQKKYLNTYLAQQVSNATKTVKFSNVNTCIALPKYDSKTMTSETFFGQCKKYLNAQGHKEDTHYLMLAMIFNEGEFKLWYDSVSQAIQSWDDFKDKFKLRYDSVLIQRERSRLFHARSQSMMDPTEQFIYESYNLAKQVYPTEDPQITFQRIIDSLMPEISALVGDLNVWTIESLLDKVTVSHNNLERQSRRKGGRLARIPPLKGTKEDLLKANRKLDANITPDGYESQNYDSSSHQGNNSSDMNHSYFRYDEESQEAQVNHSNESNDYTSSRGNGSYDSQNRFQEQEDYDDSNFRNPSEGQISDYSNYRGEWRGPPSPRYRRGNNSKYEVSVGQCRKCFQFGHYARECQNQSYVG